jgi:Fur family transcriptional regulator, peroxide stress response regulator
VRAIRKKIHAVTAPAGDLELQRRYFLSRCRDRGIRVTAQRLAVFHALIRDPGHPAADSLYEALRETMPSLSLSTVYRILESLEKEGLIRKVSAQNGVARYDGNIAPHQHLVCRSCGRMTDLVEESFARLRLTGFRFAGFIAEELDIRIVGICLECSRSASRPTIIKKRSGSRTVSLEKEENKWPN